MITKTDLKNVSCLVLIFSITSAVTCHAEEIQPKPIPFTMNLTPTGFRASLPASIAHLPEKEFNNIGIVQYEKRNIREIYETKNRELIRVNLEFYFEMLFNWGIPFFGRIYEFTSHTSLPKLENAIPNNNEQSKKNLPEKLKSRILQVIYSKDTNATNIPCLYCPGIKNDRHRFNGIIILDTHNKAFYQRLKNLTEEENAQHQKYLASPERAEFLKKTFQDIENPAKAIIISSLQHNTNNN